MGDPNKSSKELHSGEYVTMYEAKPISRVARLVGLMDLSATTRLVDLACGNAMLLGEVHDRVAHYTGVDFSEDFIRAAEARAERMSVSNCEFHCTDIVAFCTMHPGQFDVATAFDFSEHIDDADFLAIFSAVHSSLRPGGKLYLHTPNLDFFMERMRDSGLLLRQRPEHIAVRDAAQNVALLRRAGFDAVPGDVHFISHYNVLSLVHPLRHLPFVGKFFEARLFIECTK